MEASNANYHSTPIFLALSASMAFADEDTQALTQAVNDLQKTILDPGEKRHQTVFFWIE